MRKADSGPGHWDARSPLTLTLARRGEGIGGRCGAGAADILHVLMRHDLYHAGEINHLRALAQDNDAWAW